MEKRLKTLKQASNYELGEMLNMAYDLQTMISKYKHLEMVNRYKNMNSEVNKIVKSISDEIDVRYDKQVRGQSR